MTWPRSATPSRTQWRVHHPEGSDCGGSPGAYAGGPRCVGLQVGADTQGKAPQLLPDRPVNIRSSTIHNFHVHGVQFRALDVDGRPPRPEMSGPKDTAYVAPGSTVRLLLTFPDYADRASPYMFHCHLLRHEDGRPRHVAG